MRCLNDVAEHTRVERLPIGREEVPAQILRPLEAHELIIKESREFAKTADEAVDDGTNDPLLSDVISSNGSKVWFPAEHLVALPPLKGK